MPMNCIMKCVCVWGGGEMSHVWHGLGSHPRSGFERLGGNEDPGSIINEREKN